MPRGMPHCCSSYGQLQAAAPRSGMPHPSNEKSTMQIDWNKVQDYGKALGSELLGDKYKDMPSTPEAARRKPTHTKREYFDAAVSLLKGKRK